MDNMKRLKQKLSQGEFRLSSHATVRSLERVVTENDIKTCGKTAKEIIYQPDNDTWKVKGKDLDGHKLTVICSIYNGVLIVTVY